MPVTDFPASSPAPFALPDRAIKANPAALTNPGGTLMGALVIAGLLIFLALWQLPSLWRDTQIRSNPVILQDGDVQNGHCTTRNGLFVDCEAHLSYAVQGRQYESDVRLFFIDLHSGDYSVDLVISGDKPELATISIALDKYWNRVLLLAVFLLGFAAMVLVALWQTARVAAARRNLAAPGRLTLLPVEVEETGKVRSRTQYSYRAADAKRASTTLFDKGQTPLVLPDSAGALHAWAVQHEAVKMPILLDRAMTRIDLTGEERGRILEAITKAEAAAGLTPDKGQGAGRALLGRVFSGLKRGLGVLLLVLMGVVGYWLYYVLAATNSHDSFGMEVNNLMPDPVNRWACGQLQLRFGDRPAPFGCVAADFHSWK